MQLPFIEVFHALILLNRNFKLMWPCRYETLFDALAHACTLSFNLLWDKDKLKVARPKLFHLWTDWRFYLLAVAYFPQQTPKQHSASFNTLIRGNCSAPLFHTTKHRDGFPAFTLRISPFLLIALSRFAPFLFLAVFFFHFHLLLFSLCSRSEDIKDWILFMSASYCTYTPPVIRTTV